MIESRPFWVTFIAHLHTMILGILVIAFPIWITIRRGEPRCRCESPRFRYPCYPATISSKI